MCIFERNFNENQLVFQYWHNQSIDGSVDMTLTFFVFFCIIGLEWEQNTVAQIGIQLMDLSTIQTQLNIPTQESGAQINDFVTYAQKMLLSFYNFVSSFAQEVMNHATGQMEKIVPLSILDRWYQNFEAKLKRDPYFWKNLP